MANVSKMEFPLLRLPILAILEVVSTMNPYEIINFSMISSRSKRIVKLFFRSGCKFRIELYIISNPLIIIEGTKTSWRYKFTMDETLNNTTKYSFDDRRVKHRETQMRYSSSVVESAFNFFNYIDDLMNFKNFYGLSYNMTYYPIMKDMIVQEIKRLNKPVIYFHLYASENFENDVKAMVENVEIKEFLRLSVPFSVNFEMVVPSSLDHLYFVDGKWIELRNLLEFDSVRIIIKGSKLTHLELTTFFVSWMFSKSHLNLYHFEISIENREVFENVSRNLPHEEIDHNVIRKTHRLAPICVALESFDIKRNDGTLGLVFLFYYNSDPDVFMLGMFVG